MTERSFRAGQSLEDLCRACHADRMHTIMVVDAEQQPLRVVCDYCGSEHQYRGGGRTSVPGANARPAAPAAPARSPSPPSPLPLVSERELGEATAMPETNESIEALLRRVIREETGLTGVAPAERWRGGDMVLTPGRPGVQEKRWPIDTFFHKIVMLRNRLRTLEQHVNSSDLPDDQKLKLQAYITGCYGSLTSFNVLFADDADRFVGSSSD